MILTIRGITLEDVTVSPVAFGRAASRVSTIRGRVIGHRRPADVIALADPEHLVTIAHGPLQMSGRIGTVTIASGGRVELEFAVEDVVLGPEQAANGQV